MTAPSIHEEAQAIAAQWREALEFVQRHRKRANYAYVSKEELRGLAQGALATLDLLYKQALERAEAAALEPATNQIITADSAPALITPETPGGLVTL